MPVDPDLGRIREAGTDLDESSAEVLVEDVEVVAGHPSLGGAEREPREVTPARAARRGGHPLELLRDPDRRHPRPASRLRPLQVGAHHLDLAVALGKTAPPGCRSPGIAPQLPSPLEAHLMTPGGSFRPPPRQGPAAPPVDPTPGTLSDLHPLAREPHTITQQDPRDGRASDLNSYRRGAAVVPGDQVAP